MKRLAFSRLSIHKQLFITFSLIISVIVAALLITVSLVQAQNVKENHSRELSRRGASVSRELDSLLENMESVKRQFMYDADTMNYYHQYLTEDEVVAQSVAFSEINHQLYRAIAGSIPQVYLLSIYGENGSVIVARGGRTYTCLSNETLTEMGLFGGEFENGKRIITPSQSGDEQVVRLVTPFVTPKDSKTRAVIEVQMQYEAFTDVIEAAKWNTLCEIYVVDRMTGEVIYPWALEADVCSIYPDGVSETDKGLSGRKELYAGVNSSYCNWTVIVTEQDTAYNQSIYQIRATVLLVGILSLWAILCLVYMLSKKITAPLGALSDEFKGIMLENLSEVSTHQERTYSEFDELRDSFEVMRQNLNQAILDNIEVRREQMQTELLTLQSKMHPHFVNNVLASIRILLMQGDAAAADSMCRSLTGMLSYTQGDYEGLVAIEDELSYCENYINLMELRHNGKIAYHVDISKEHRNLQIPKMVIQPLVENSIKHGMMGNPIEIYVTVQVTGDCFAISIRDNGCGFEHARIPQDVEEDPEHGIGLKNIKARLKLIYGESGVLHIDSVPGKTTVTIRGKMMEAHRDENDENCDC